MKTWLKASLIVARVWNRRLAWLLLPFAAIDVLISKNVGGAIKAVTPEQTKALVDKLEAQCKVGLELNIAYAEFEKYAGCFWFSKTWNHNHIKRLSNAAQAYIGSPLWLQRFETEWKETHHA